MNIFLSFTPEYAIHAAELLFTIREHSHMPLDVHMLVDSESPEQVLPLFNLLNLQKCEYHVYPSSLLNAVLSPLHSSGLVHKMTYGKLLAVKLLADKDRVLCLDVDMLVVREGLDALYSSDLGTYYAAVVEETSVEAYAKDEMQQCKVKQYFNGGLMLLNMAQIKKDKIDTDILQLMTSPTLYMQKKGIQDQTISNTAFKENVQFVNPIYNIQSILFGYPIYDQLAVRWGYKNQREMISNCIISHMQGAKPWSKNYFTWQPYQLMWRKWQLDYWNLVRTKISAANQEFAKMCYEQ